MLKSLQIQNYALIDFIDIQFAEGLHIVTGETGAGKSIILGALGLIMGKRADKKVLHNPSKNCILELIIDISTHKLDAFLIANEMEKSKELIIRRVISNSGKSRAFVNDLPVPLKTLQELTSNLIQTHNQFDNLDLAQAAYQLDMLDALADNGDLLENYTTLFDQWVAEKKALKQLKEDIAAFEREREFVHFQYNELTDANFEDIKLDDLESTLAMLSNAEVIQQSLRLAHFQLTEEEQSIVSQLTDLIKNLNRTCAGIKPITEILDQLHLQVEQMQDLSNQMVENAEKIEFDPEKIANLQSQLDTINKLLLKHNVKSIADLSKLKLAFEQKLTRQLENAGTILSKEKNILEYKTKLDKLAKKLSKNRKNTSIEFCARVEDQLRQLAMPFVKMEAKFDVLPTLSSKGIDKFELLFSANKGSKPEAIKNIASGGELSRLSLSIKSILAGNMSLPTLIFDEIEAGISGEVALKMGKILKQLSQNHQIINITHSAQIASRADLHYFVYKTHESNKTTTNIKVLNKDERVIEIAKMLSGDPPSSTAIQNATELIQIT